MQKTKISLLISSILLPVGYVSSAFSAETETVAETIEATESGVEQLETIVVSDTPFSQQVGTQKITEDQIKNRPLKDGNITELLRNNPNVQFSNTSDTSTGAGEIAPNEVSIHGEAYYNNNYTINGLSNNDNIDPAYNNGVGKNTNNVSGGAPTDFPAGGTQSFWIDTSLLKSVEAFDSNISAKYGNFTGGVINAELKEPSLERPSGKIFYRTTRDSWAEFHIDESKEDSYHKAENLGDQPEFKKEQYGVIVNQPINDKSALLFSYSRNQSKIPFHHAILDQWEKQKRISETYLLSGIYLPDNGDLWKATLMYAPHKSVYFKKNVKDGKFTNSGGGFSAALEWQKELSWAKMKSYIGYKKSVNKTEHEANEFIYHGGSYRLSPTIYPNGYGWCSAYRADGNCTSANEGGYGTFKTEKQTFTFKQDYEGQRFDTANIEHKINFGWEVNIAKAAYEREHDVYNYIYAEKPSGSWLREYTLYPQRDVSVTDNSYSAYIEDSVMWKRWNATFGVRVDHSEYLGNTDIAPRFSTSYDVFGDQSTQLFGGINRYYSGSILSYKLREAVGSNTKYNRKNETASFSAKSATGRNYGVSDLKTPYSDEYSLGISQKIYNSLWTLKWVDRHGKDQFTRVTSGSGENTKYAMTNDGRSKNNTFSLSVRSLDKYKFKYAEFDWEMGGQISKTKKNYNTYDAAAEDDGFEMMILSGKLQPIGNGLPAGDYNNPWSAFFQLNTHFPTINLQWSQRLSYQSGYRHWDTSSQICPAYGAVCGSYSGKVKVYEEKTQGSYFMLDWHFAYKQPTYQNQFIELTLDVNNVLNRKVVASQSSGSSSVSTYKMGRNFWLGASYNW